jgi:hypothetical protein
LIINLIFIESGGKMKILTVTIMACALLVSGIGILSSANAQTETIASETVAKEIAANAGGTYVQGAAAPALTGSQTALPIIDQATGQVLGHIVAEQANLVAALNAAGFTEVATAVGATAAGTVAGTTVAAGIGVGTTTALAVGAAVAVGLAVSSSSDGTTTTTHH